MGPQPRENPAEEARRLRREIAVRFERLAYLTHMNHEVDYANWASRLPEGVLPAHDGLVIQLEDR